MNFRISFVTRLASRHIVALIWRQGRVVACALPQGNRNVAAMEARALVRALVAQVRA